MGGGGGAGYYVLVMFVGRIEFAIGVGAIALVVFGVAEALVAVFGACGACWALAVAARLAASTCEASAGGSVLLYPKGHSVAWPGYKQGEEAQRAGKEGDLRSVDPTALRGGLALVVDEADLPRCGGGRVRLAKGHIHGLTMAMCARRLSVVRCGGSSEKGGRCAAAQGIHVGCRDAGVGRCWVRVRCALAVEVAPARSQPSARCQVTDSKEREKKDLWDQSNPTMTCVRAVGSGIKA